MRWMYISTMQTKTSLGACRKCLCWLPGLSGSPAMSSRPTGQPRRKPAGQMYSASGAVHSAVADQQIGDDAVMRHRRLVGKSRASTAALDHVKLYYHYHYYYAASVLLHNLSGTIYHDTSGSMTLVVNNLLAIWRHFCLHGPIHQRRLWEHLFKGRFINELTCLLLLPFYGHYTGQPALASTTVKNSRILLEQFHYLQAFADGS